MFDVRKSVADLALEPYLFTDMDGTVRQMPNLKTLTTGDANRIYSGEVLDVLREVLDEDAMAAVNAIPLAAMPGLVADWAKHSEVEPGESVASSPSTASTARPSKQTSPSAGSKTRKR